MGLVLGVEIVITQKYKLQETKRLLAEAIPMFIRLITCLYFTLNCKQACSLSCRNSSES